MIELFQLFDPVRKEKFYRVTRENEHGSKVTILTTSDPALALDCLLRQGKPIFDYGSRVSLELVTE
jgi:hypothetical protein